MVKAKYRIFNDIHVHTHACKASESECQNIFASWKFAIMYAVKFVWATNFKINLDSRLHSTSTNRKWVIPFFCFDYVYNIIWLINHKTKIFNGSFSRILFYILIDICVCLYITSIHQWKKPCIYACTFTFLKLFIFSHIFVFCLSQV